MEKILMILIFMVISPLVHSVEVSKEHWASSMETVLPAAFCNKNMYFRRCFSVDATECEEVSASATRICLKKHESDIPRKLSQPQDGTHWGTIIGQCAGEAYELSLLKKRIDSNLCNNPKNWM